MRNISVLLILIVNLTSAAAERADYLGRWDLTVRDGGVDRPPQGNSRVYLRGRYEVQI